MDRELCIVGNDDKISEQSAFRQSEMTGNVKSVARALGVSKDIAREFALEARGSASWHDDRWVLRGIACVNNFVLSER
jgi:hypothetical protein